jgi:uracil-DNA glycosylase family 4
MKCHANGIEGYGNAKYGVMIVGTSPAREELRTGKPYTGQAGRVLDSMLSACGWSRDKVYITNAVCTPVGTTLEKSQFDACRDRLNREIQHYDPKLVIFMGSNLCEYIEGRPLSKTRGAVLYRNNRWYMYTYEPAGILHGSTLLAYDIFRDFSKIRRVIDEYNPSMGLVSYEVVSSIEQAQNVLYNLPTNRPVALDVETSRKNDFGQDKDDIDTDIFGDELLCVGIGTYDHTYVLTPSALSSELVWPTTQVRWTMHNALSDVQVIKKELDVWLHVAEDTMLQSYSLDERPGNHGLKPLSREYIGADFYEDAVRKYYRGKSGGMAAVPKAVLYEYNAKDVAYTARLADFFCGLQARDNVRKMYETLLIDAVNVFKEIQWRGVAVDRKLHRSFGIDWMQRYLEEEERLIAYANSKGWDGYLNLNSTQLGKCLYQVLGLPGGPTTKREQLEKLAPFEPFVQNLLKFRDLSKVIGTYIMGLERDLKTDGRVHSVVKLHSTVTGRPTYEKPPLQVIPTTYKYEDEQSEYSRLRELFTVSNDNYLMVEVDYQRAEIWAGYGWSKDQNLLADLNGDYHANVAAEVMNKPLHTVKEADRREMKYVTFGIMYGRGADSLTRDVKRSVAECQEYIDRWFGKYSDYRRSYLELQRLAVDGEDIQTFTGRKRRLIVYDRYQDYHALNQAVNFPIQSLSWDMTLLSLIELHYALKQYDSYVLLTVHDSILFEVSKRYYLPAMRLIRDIMTKDRWGWSTPIDMKVGKNWGTGKSVHWHSDDLYTGEKCEQTCQPYTLSVSIVTTAA